MRRFHLAAGIAAIAGFLITGQFMRHHTPPLAEMSDSVRLMLRSRHIYILGAGLTNLMLGLYFQGRSQAWPRIVQAAGSTLVLASPALLLTAFAVEPSRGLHEALWWSHAGLYALFGGCMLHLASFLPAFARDRRR